MRPGGQQIRRRFRERFVSLDVGSRLVEMRCCCRASRKRKRKWGFSEQEPGASGASSTGVIENIGEDCSIRVESVVHRWTNRGKKKKEVCPVSLRVLDAMVSTMRGKEKVEQRDIVSRSEERKKRIAGIMSDSGERRKGKEKNGVQE